MKKAAEYAAEYKAAGETMESLASVWNQMFIEFKEIAESCKATSDSAALAIFDEQCNKWKAFARLAGPGIKPTGFGDAFEKKLPFLYYALQNERSRQQEWKLKHGCR